MPDVIKNCQNCGCQLEWKHPGLKTTMASSVDIPDWPICHSCMVEHCVSTQCFGCGYGKYPDCQFLSLKRLYLNPDNT